jgi:predicted RNase H-like nuclease (RuvC/YqgF family)
MSYAELLERLQALRAQTRALEQQVERQARSMSPLTLDDEREMSNIQSRLDHAYRAANRMAPPPLPCERPAFHRRLLDGLRVYSDTWRGKDISQVTDPTALRVIEDQLADAARKRGPTYGMRDGEIKAVETSSGGGPRFRSEAQRA